MYSPIETLLMVNGGQDAVLASPFVGESPDYDPTSEVDFVPSQPQRYDVRGIWSDSYEDALREGEIGVFLISATGLPDGVLPDKATITIEGIDVAYTITRARRRVWMAKTDGFNLYLAA